MIESVMVRQIQSKGISAGGHGEVLVGDTFEDLPRLQL